MKLYSVVEAAAILGLNRTRVSYLCKAGELGAVRIGRFYAISEKDLQKFQAKTRPKRGRPPGTKNKPKPDAAPGAT